MKSWHQKRVYVCGVWDLFHRGHVNLLSKAKDYGKHIVAGICNDDTVETYKDRPSMPYEDRLAVIEVISLIDEIIYNAPAVTNEDFYVSNDLDIHVHGDDHKGNSAYDVPEKMGIMRWVPYTQGISSTEICDNIVKRYLDNAI